MKEERKSIHGEWSSRWAFILAATGAAVGLGNIWKFPYIVGQHGGGAFVLIYLICVLTVGLPLMMAEILLGRCGRQNPINSIETIAQEQGKSRQWRWTGVLNVVTGPLILSFYSVIAGWALYYVFRAATGIFSEITPQAADEFFENFISNPFQLVIWHTAIIAFTLVVIARGLEKGIEKAINFMFPIMMLLIIILVLYGMNSGFFTQTLEYMFRPSFDQITPNDILVALGQAFFSLSLATGAIMMYGAYLPRNTSVTKSAFFIACADTGVAILAGLAIFPIVFANGLEPGAGPGLIFKTLPIAFGKMPYGSLFAVLFFIMLVFAAFTSAISLLEPSVAWFIENKGISRVRATIIVGSIVWVIGFGTIFAFNGGADVRLFGLNFFELIDYVTSNIMLPLGGLLLALFTAWRMKKASLKHELQIEDKFLFKSWLFTLRYITPILILLVFLEALGIFKLF